MNVLFYLVDFVLDKVFFEKLKEVGLMVLKGYCLVGGMCVSIYNVMFVEGVEVLVKFMCEFEEYYV